MPSAPSHLPLFALVDDQIHSARLLSRTLRQAAHPARIRWLGDAIRATRTLERQWSGNGGELPDMIIVDLKSSSDATGAFIAATVPQAQARDIPLVGIAANLYTEQREGLLRAGASAVFERPARLSDYRTEMDHLIEFWVRETLTWPIRA